MLIDLARNDIGRIAQIGSVHVTEKMAIEKYSHVQHIVSNVEGLLKPGSSNLDVLKATFPAGTLSGAPKVRAMEIIDEMEPVKRGIYGGACGYLFLRRRNGSGHRHQNRCHLQRHAVCRCRCRYRGGLLARIRTAGNGKQGTCRHSCRRTGSGRPGQHLAIVPNPSAAGASVTEQKHLRISETTLAPDSLAFRLLIAADVFCRVACGRSLPNALSQALDAIAADAATRGAVQDISYHVLRKRGTTTFLSRGADKQTAETTADSQGLLHCALALLLRGQGCGAI